MVLEHAVLNVLPGREADFEAAFARALPLIEATPGFEGLRLLRGIENSHDYVLLVEWRSLEDHTVGFRGSDRYPEWSRLLHDFYDPFPTVGHFTEVVAGSVSAGEDLADIEAVRTARQEIADGAPPIPWEQVKADLGLA